MSAKKQTVKIRVKKDSGKTKTRPSKKATTKKTSARQLKKDQKALVGENIDFASLALKKADASGNKNKGDKNRPLGIYRKMAISFIVLTILLVAIIFYFSLVKVLIVLIPNQERISDNFSINIYDKGAEVTASDGVVGIVRQAAVEQTKVYEATGKEILGEEVTGKVIIINNYNKSQPLVAKTRLLSPENKLFRINKTINVPAGGSVEVDVYADEPSQEMAVGPTTFTIPGLWSGLQDKIYAESKEAMKYSQKIKTTIKQSDIDGAAKDLRAVLIAEAKKDLDNIYKDYSQVIYEIDNNSITQQLSGKVGEEKDKFSVTMKTMITVVAFPDNKIFQNAELKLAAIVPDNKEIIEFNKKDISYSLANYNLKQGMASIDVSFVGKMALRKDAEIIDRSKLLGLNREQLTKYLDTFPEIVGYEIKFSPAFIKKVPNLIDRIKIEIKR